MSKLVLVCYRNYRYPGCTTRTSVPSQPTALQKSSYKKEPYLQNKNHPTTHTTPQPNPTQSNTPNTKPNTTTKPTQPNPERKKLQLAKAVKINYKTKISSTYLSTDSSCIFSNEILYI